MSAKERKKDYPCLKCEKHVKKNDFAIQCNMCELWIHKQCAKMEDVLFEHLVKQEKLYGYVSWACTSCSSFSAKLSAGLKKVDERLTKVEATVDTHTGELIEVKASVEDALAKVDGVIADRATLKGEVQSETADLLFGEIKERENRRNNVIVHGLKEPDGKIKDAELRIKADLKVISDLFAQLSLDLKPEEHVKFARRLGERPTGDGSRPLLMGCITPEVRERILSNSRKLAEKKEWENVTVVADLTKRQREEENALRNEAVRLNTERTDEEAKNWEWKVVGRRGSRRLIKGKMQVAGAGAANGTRNLRTKRH